jgi:hypothetical protein
VGEDAGAVPVVKKFKASDLPLPSATRTAIEGLAHSFKKKGGYDSIRKQVWEKFEASVCLELLPLLSLSLTYMAADSLRTTKRKSPKPSSKSPSRKSSATQHSF